MSLFSGWQKYPWKPFLCWWVNHKDKWCDCKPHWWRFHTSQLLSQMNKRGKCEKGGRVGAESDTVILTDCSQKNFCFHNLQKFMTTWRQCSGPRWTCKRPMRCPWAQALLGCQSTFVPPLLPRTPRPVLCPQPLPEMLSLSLWQSSYFGTFHSSWEIPGPFFFSWVGSSLARVHVFFVGLLPCFVEASSPLAFWKSVCMCRGHFLMDWSFVGI